MTQAPLTLASLPLFPLATVLYPGGLLPLRVFEVRYLDMVGKCHKAHAPFGVVALREGSEVLMPGATEERLHTVGTLAHITALEQPQPGLIHLQCMGEQRFRIDQLKRLRHGLWVADVTLLPSDAAVAIPPDLAHTAQALRQVHHNLRASRPDAALPAEADSRYDDCAWVANRWCELLPLPLPQAQQMMSLDNPLVRLELVADVLGKAGIQQAAG